VQTIRHIVWDWNGTILDDIGACVGTINRMLGKRSLKLLDADRYRDVFGFPVRNCYIALGFDLDREDWDAVTREFHANYAEESRAVGLRPGVRAMLDRLTGCGMPMSILSASPRSLLESDLGRFGMRGMFHHVYGLGDLYATSKMSLGRCLLNDIREPPDTVLLVGDTVHDHEVAHELGWQCVLVGGGHQSDVKLRHRGCTFFTDITGLGPWLESALSGGIVSGG
jgi:phosphoglycolate phosphatase